MLFLHNSYGTSELPNCGNLVGADCMGNLRWRIRNRPCTLGRPIRIRPCILGRPIQNFCSQFYFQLYSQFHFQVYSCFTPSFNSNITTNLLHHIVSCLSSNSKLSPLYSLCFINNFLFCSKVASLQFPANGTCRKRPTL